MTLEPAQQRLLADLAALLAEVTGEDAEWGARVTPASRLEADLRLDSLEVAALSDRLAGAYGDRVDLAGFIAGLEIDEIIALTAGDVIAYVTSRLPGGALSAGTAATGTPDIPSAGTAATVAAAKSTTGTPCAGTPATGAAPDGAGSSPARAAPGSAAAAPAVPASAPAGSGG